MLQPNVVDSLAALLAELEHGWHAIVRPLQLPSEEDWAI